MLEVGGEVEPLLRLLDVGMDGLWATDIILVSARLVLLDDQLAVSTHKYIFIEDINILDNC